MSTEIKFIPWYNLATFDHTNIFEKRQVNVNDCHFRICSQIFQMTLDEYDDEGVIKLKTIQSKINLAEKYYTIDFGECICALLMILSLPTEINWKSVRKELIGKIWMLNLSVSSKDQRITNSSRYWDIWEVWCMIIIKLMCTWYFRIVQLFQRKWTFCGKCFEKFTEMNGLPHPPCESTFSQHFKKAAWWNAKNVKNTYLVLENVVGEPEAGIVNVYW